MSDVFLADAIVFREVDNNSDDDTDSVFYEGLRSIRVVTGEAEISIASLSSPSVPLPQLLDGQSGAPIEYEETEVFEITFDGPNNTRLTTTYISFFDTNNAGPLEFDYLVRIKGPGFPTPAVGTNVDSYLQSLNAEIAASSETEIDPPFRPLLGEFADGQTVDYSDIQGFTLQGGGLTIGEATLVALLYDAGLDRNGNVDEPGLNFWIDQREAGLNNRQLATAFYASQEFINAYGEAIDETAENYLSDLELVSQLYRNVLDRESDQAGLDFWTGVLADGVLGRIDMLLAFADSPENRGSSVLDENINETEEGIWAI